MTKQYKKFKKKHKVIHLLIVSTAIVMLWRGIWGLLDLYLFADNQTISYFVSVMVAFAILYLDNFHLKDIE